MSEMSVLPPPASGTVLSSDFGTSSITSPVSSLAETTMVSKTVAGGVIRQDDVLEAEIFLAFSGAASTKVIAVYYGSLSSTLTAAASTVVMWIRVRIFNRGNPQSQYMMLIADTSPVNETGQVNSTSGNFFIAALGTVDSTVNQTLKVTGKVNNVSDSILFRGWNSRVVRVGE